MKEVIKLVKSSKDIVLNKSYVDAQKEKGVSDYVTLVDIKVQEHIFNGLKILFPDHQFFGEESEQQKLDFNRPVWILDPLDGTTNLIHSYPQVAVSLAFWNEGRIEFGVVYNPYTDELFTASIGKGSFLNGEPIQVSDHKSLADCLVSIGTSPYQKDDSEAFFRISHKLFH
jgi:myo-inositol-1(or 4)-monophosphatase